MPIDSSLYESFLRGPCSRYEDRVDAEQRKQLEETAWILPVPVPVPVPVTKSFEWPDEGSMSASSTLNQDYQQDSPQAVDISDMSVTTDISRDRRGNRPQPRQTQQTPLALETRIDVTNHTLDWRLESKVEDSSNERVVTSSTGTWEMPSLVDPSLYQEPARYEPINSSAENSQNPVPLRLPLEKWTIRNLVLSPQRDQPREPMTDVGLQRSSQTLSSAIVHDRASPMPPMLRGGGPDQVFSTRRDQTMQRRDHQSTFTNEGPYTSIVDSLRHHGPGSREQGTLVEHGFTQPMNGLSEPLVVDSVLNPNSTTHFTDAAMSNHHSLYATNSRDGTRAASKRPINRGSEPHGSEYKRPRFSSRRTCIKCCDFLEDQGMCRRCAYGFKGFRPLCSFTKIVEINLFRLHTDPNVPLPELGIDEAVISRIEGKKRSAVRTIGITQGYGERILEFKVQEFDKSTINLQEVPQTEQGIYSVPFAIVDLEEAARRTQLFILSNIQPYIRGKLEEGDQITRLFFKLAMHIASGSSPQSDFILKVLYFWTAARMIEGDWTMKGTETLELGPNSVIYDAPFIDYQFSGIIKDRILLPLQKTILKKLNDMIYKDHKKNWLSIFVGTFILLNTYGLLIKQQREFSQSIGATTRYSSMELIRSIHHGSKVLLQHFHAVKGQKPFKDILRQGQDAQEVARFTSRQESDILRRLAALVQGQGERFQDLAKTNEYEQDHWFTGQLFLPEWKPPNTIEHAPPAEDKT